MFLTFCYVFFNDENDVCISQFLLMQIKLKEVDRAEIRDEMLGLNISQSQLVNPIFSSHCFLFPSYGFDCRAIRGATTDIEKLAALFLVVLFSIIDLTRTRTAPVLCKCYTIL